MFRNGVVSRLQPGHHSSLTSPYLQHTANQERHDRCGNQLHSRELLMMGIVMLETYWAYKTYNKISSGIWLVFYSSVITMMHGPINIKFSRQVIRRKSRVIWSVNLALRVSTRLVFLTWNGKAAADRHLMSVGTEHCKVQWGKLECQSVFETSISRILGNSVTKEVGLILNPGSVFDAKFYHPDWNFSKFSNIPHMKFLFLYSAYFMTKCNVNHTLELTRSAPFIKSKAPYTLSVNLLAPKLFF